MIIDIISGLFLALGSILGLTGAYGIVKFPDFYTRVHAASITDTLCAACFIFALVLKAGFTLITIKLLMVLALLWITSPTAGHALVKAAFHAGLAPKLHGDKSAGTTTGTANQVADS